MEPGSNSEALSWDTVAVITDRLKLLATRKAEMWWDIGCLLDAMATRGTGIRDWAAHAQKVIGIDRREARRIRRIASMFSREIAMRFGIEKLELLVKLVEALPDVPPVMDPLRVEVISLHDRAVVPVTFAESTTDDLRFTVKLLSGRKTASDARFGQMGEVRDALEKALRKALGRKAPKVKVESVHDARQCMALIDMDPGELDAVGRTLIAQAKTMRKARAHKGVR